MRKTIRWILAASLLLLGAAFAGCFFEMISWSPDGRHLVFASKGSLWRWNGGAAAKTEALQLRLAVSPSETQEGKKEEGKPVPGKVYSCRHTPSGDEMLIFTVEPSALYLLNIKSMLCELVAEDPDPTFDISRDGKRIYYIRENKAKQETVLYCRVQGKESRAVFSSRTDFRFPRESPDGKRILYADENALCVWSLDAGTSSALKQAESGYRFYWPVWVDDQTVLYLTARDEDNEEGLGELYIHSLKDASTRSLCKDVGVLYSPLSVSGEGRRVLITQGRRDAEGKIDADNPGVWQAASVDLISGKTTVLTDAPFGACWPTLSPDGGKLAYLTFPMEENDSLLEILVLDTGRRIIAWRTYEERLWADADTLRQNGKKEEARAALEKFVRDYPESPLRDAALSQIKALEN